MQCPYCKEDILEGALKCKHCGSMLGSPEAVPAPASDKSKIVAGILALLGLGNRLYPVVLDLDSCLARACRGDSVFHPAG